MKWIQFIVILILLNNQIGYAQSYQIPKTELLDFLYHTKSSITEISNIDFNRPFLPIDDPKFGSRLNQLIKNQKGLFITLDQTGRVYKATSETKNEIIFTRIDSTYFWGYNGGAIDFSYKDTLFSFGGGGFWRLNGQLRYFSEDYHEWNIKTISDELPLLIGDLHFINAPLNKAYYIQRPIFDEATGKTLFGWNLCNLNLASKENRVIGPISKRLLNLLQNSPLIYVRISLPSLNGILYQISNENILLFNFDENSIYKLLNQQIIDLITGSSKGIQLRNNFQIGDSVYYTRPNDSTFKLHSFKISMKDFVKEPYPIYESTNPFIQFTWLMIVGGILLSVLVPFGIYRLKKKRQILSNSQVEIEITNQDSEQVFNQIEINLIEQIIGCCSKGTFISPDQINSTLGVSKKSIETQKKIKGDTINRINYKFKTLFELDVEFIERLRTESDRRFYNYIISKENAALYKERFKK